MSVREGFRFRALASESARERRGYLDEHELTWDGSAIFKELLREWGGGRLTVEASVPVMLRDIARRLPARSLIPAQANAAVYEIDVTTDHGHPALELWQELCEELYPEMGVDDRSYRGRKAESE